jgi:hypothetical protein
MDVALFPFHLEAVMADTGHLKTQAAELVKQHVEFDVNNRIEYVYTVRADADNGTPCSVVRYSYDGLSSRVVFMKESTGTWNSAWDLF